MARVFVLCHDAANESPRYFIRLGLGIFWECGPRDMAKEFRTRRDAVKTMQSAGKHHDGWRVIQESR